MEQVRKFEDSLRAGSDEPADRTLKPGEKLGGYEYALVAIKHGVKVQREGWNGKGMYVVIQRPDAHSKMSLPYIYMWTADKNRVPWLCSQTDALADDWQVYDGIE